MRYLKTNTATRITVGPFFDKTDGITPEVALTATNEKLTMMVDTGGVPTLVLDATATAAAGDNDFVHVTGDDAGYYDLELTAAQLNYLGRATLAITYATDHCPVFHEFMILPAGEYDRLTSTTGPIPDFGITDRGTAAAIAAGTITLRSGHGISNTSASVLRLVSGTNAVGKSRVIAYSGAGDVFNVDPAWTANGETTPSGTLVYIVQDLPPNPTSTVPTVNLSAAAVKAIWDALTTALTTAGSIGKKLANWVLGADNKVIASSDAHTGAQFALSTQGKADVNAEVLDVLNTDTFAEPGQGTPAATTTLVGKIGYLYKAFRNKKTQTSTTFSLFNDDAVTVDQKATVSDNGTTATVGEIATGP